MNQTIEQQVIETIRVLPEEKQREVLAYAKQISEGADAEKSKNAANEETTKKRKFIEVIEELRKSLPADVWEGYPTDGSLNHDHYLYGSPKKK
ncbi:MAG: hypothetical protein LH472_09050 [Pyrinomonadaceae bacterium]|nr:hypothetical protein [Pyrinomonadaceae bacterium]